MCCCQVISDARKGLELVKRSYGGPFFKAKLIDS